MSDDGFDTDTPLILHLRGVFMRKNTDEYKIDGYEPDTVKHHITYTRFPRKFCGLKTWIENTQIHCFSCTNGFSDRPVPITNSYKKTASGSYEFNVKGIACSFPCAQRYINKSPKNERWELENMLRIVFYIFYMKKVETIPEAYDMYEQERFGGTISDSDFRARNKHILDTLLSDMSDS